MLDTFYIWTIGCQMNKSESTQLADRLEDRGYQRVADAESASLIILNSCVVRASAEKRVINKLQALKALKKNNPQIKIALTGCIVGPDTNGLNTAFPYVDYFFPPGKVPNWVAAPGGVRNLPRNPQVSSLVPIMQGCNNYCSYCIVPYRRGRETSRSPVDIIKEVTSLVAGGTKEVTLLGQNVNSYGQGLEEPSDLAGLLHQLNSLAGLERIRFLTNHPKDMQTRLIDAIARLDKVCEQINLPVQSGDDDILQAMRRGYSAGHYRELIAEIRARIPGIALSTDVIVGFPGETLTQFNHTAALLADLRFDVVHVAAYSPRAETLAARTLPDDVPLPVKQSRLQQIEKMQAEIAFAINSQLMGKVVEVLVEGSQKNRWFGRTRGDKIVFFNTPGDLQGRLVNVRITRTGAWSLSGRAELI